MENSSNLVRRVVRSLPPLFSCKWNGETMKFALAGGKSEREEKPFETNGGRDILFAPEWEIAISERESVLETHAFRPINEYSRVQATFNERCNLLALLGTRSSCGFQLIGPTILRPRQRHCPETDAIFDLGRGLSTILHFLLEALWKLVDLVHPTCPFDPSFFSNSSLVPLTARLPLRIPILFPFTRKRYTKKPRYFEVEITF